MKKTLAAEEALEDFLQGYLAWVDENVEKKDRYLPKKKFVTYCWLLKYNNITGYGSASLMLLPPTAKSTALFVGDFTTVGSYRG